MARAALAAGWLRLALTAADKALRVNELPANEYAYGMNYGALRIDKNINNPEML
jgi:hypothetical protein